MWVHLYLKPFYMESITPEKPELRFSFMHFSRSIFQILLLILVGFLHSPVDAQVLLLRSHSAENPPLQITRYKNPWIQREVSVAQVLLNGNFQTIALPRATVPKEVWMLNFPDESMHVFLGTGDTLCLTYSDTAGWKGESGNALTLNRQIWDLDYRCDQALIQARMNRAVPFVKQVRYFADTLTASASRYENDLVRRYLFHRAALTEISADSRSRRALMQRYFKENSQSDNPAWLEAFHQLFGPVLQQELIRDRSDSLKTAISRVSSDSLRDYFARRYPEWNPELLDLTLVLGLYREGYRKTFSRDLILRNLNAIKGRGSTSVLAFIGDVEQDWARYRKGVRLPEFTCALGDKTISSEQMMKKPLYLAYYPEFNQDTHRELLMLKAMFTKYKSGMQFLVVVNTATESGLDKAIDEIQPGFDVVSMSRCSAEFSWYPERSDTRSYLLFEAGGAIFQAPAEGPETGVDAAFSTLIRKK